MSWLFAQLYERSSIGADKRGVAAWRAAVVGRATGDVVEIGAGNGLNLKHYPAEVRRLVLTEPSRAMRSKLRRRLRVPEGADVEVAEGVAEAIPLPDASVDTVVSTLVLCSVTSQAQALAEARRVLRPDGRLLFIEHVLADDPAVARWQRRLVPVCRCLAAGCDPSRDTAAAIEGAGFAIEDALARTRMPGLLGKFVPVIHGAAIRTG